MVSKFTAALSITEESSGCMSHVWVEKRRKGYVPFGNELGPMAVPCASAVDAPQRSGFDFSMVYMQIRTILPPAEFEAPMAGIDLSGVSVLFINGVQVKLAAQAAALAAFVPKN
jgi:hypothetical protein